MAYTRVNWQNSPSHATPLSAENLNVMDAGIASLDTAVTEAEGDISSLETEVGDQATTISGLQTTVNGHTTSIGTLANLTTTEKGNLVGAINEVDADVSDVKEDLTLKADLPTETIENASIASFTDGAEDVPVKELKVAIEPIQDLHGYDNPWPAGGGKNKLPIACESKTVSGVTYTVYTNEDGAVTKIHAQGTATSAHSFNILANHSASNPLTVKAGNYYFLGITDGASKVYDFNLRKLGETSDIVQTTTKVSVVLEEDTAFQSCYLYVYNGVTINTDIYPMLYLQTESDAFAPYSNICPISGRNSVTVTRTGVNVWDEEWELGTLDFSTGADVSASDRIRSKGYIRCLPNATYYIEEPTTTKNVRLVYYDANKNYISESGWKGKQIIVTPQTASYIRFACGSAIGTTYGNNISINYPSTYTDYIPSQVEKYPIPLSSTIYGGTLDVGTGVLTVETALITLDGTETGWSKYSTTTMLNSSLAIDTLPATGANIKGYCSHVATVNENINNSYLAHLNNGRGLEFRLLTTYWGLADNEVATWKAFLASQYANGTPVQILTYLQNPTTVQLTPAQVTTLLKDNNIFCDSGDVKKLIYRADLGAYIEKLINA